MIEPDACGETLGRASLPTSPKSPCDHPPISYDNVESAPRRRSGSLSRVRDSLHRKSIDLHHRVERKLLEMAESHLEIPLTLSGPQGLMFHVPDLPGSHSRESVVGVLHQSLSWLRSNPDRGRTPFTPTNASQTSTPTDLLRPDFNCAELPSLRPSISHKSSPRDSVSGMDSNGDRTRHDRNTSDKFLNHSSPNACGALIDLEESPASSPPLEQQQSSKLKLKHKIHPDLTSLVSYFEQRSTAPPPTTRVTTLRPNHPGGKPLPVSAQTRDERGGTEQTREIVTRSKLDSLPCLEEKQQSSQVRRKPVINTACLTLTNSTVSSTPSAFLSVGLRPIPAPTVTTGSASQARAKCSTENLSGKKHSSQRADNPVPQLRTLSRKQNGRDLRTLHLDQASNHGVYEPRSDRDDFTQMPKHMRLQNKVVEKIDRYESSLPSLPAGGADLWRTATRRQKRWGMYGPPATAHQPTDSQELSPGSRANGKGKPGQVQQYQPYRPTRGNPDKGTGLPDLRRAQLGPRDRTLRNKAELFLVPSDEPCTSATIPDPLSQSNVFTAGKVTRNSDTKPPPPSSGLHSNDQPHHVAHSRSIVRKGTFQQLGGRVVEVRKRFEPDKIDTEIDLDTSPARNKSQTMLGQASHEHRLQAKPRPLPSDKQPHRHLSSRNLQKRSQQPSPSTSTKSSSHKSHNASTANTTNTRSSASPQSSKTSERISPFDPHDPSNPSIYSSLHPDFAKDPQAFQDSMAEETRRRLVAAADESDFARSWKQAVETDRDSEVIRKLDFAWQWKRFSDREWNGRDRARMVKDNRGKKEG